MKIRTPRSIIAALACVFLGMAILSSTLNSTSREPLVAALESIRGLARETSTGDEIRLTGGAEISQHTGTVAEVDRARIERVIANGRDRGSITSPRTAGQPKPYAFYPQGGQLWRDLWLNNFVDQDPGSGIRDWDCTGYTYNGHRGHDSTIRGFAEQDAGIPVFAVLDGTVLDVQDGEPDRNMESISGCVTPSNYVILDHGNTHHTWYFHLKSGSVSVGVGETVSAGTEIGMTASSGCSTRPHLHFESRFAGSHFEPTAGPCGPERSNWENEQAIRRDTYLWNIVVTDENIDDFEGPPFDTSRNGTFVLGRQTVRFWIQAMNLPASSRWRITYLRPDDSQRRSFDGDFGRDAFLRRSWWRFFSTATFDQTGEWTLRIEINDIVVSETPISVVASESEIVNRPPLPVAVLFDPDVPLPNRTTLCRVESSLLNEDPDYDLVTYQYTWLVNDQVARTTAHAGRADALAADQYGDGDMIECRVVPSDGELEAIEAKIALKAGVFECGDADQSGGISAIDALVTLRGAVSSQTQCPRSLCDADANGSITASDALRILSRAVGIIGELECR